MRRGATLVGVAGYGAPRTAAPHVLHSRQRQRALRRQATDDDAAPSTSYNQLSTTIK